MPSPILSRPFLFAPVVAVMLLAALATFSTARADATDRLGLPGPISFDSTDHMLAWSSNPSPGYFKQEYVPAGQEVETYTKMVLIEAAAGVDVKTALASQVQMLNQRKSSDPLVNLDVIMNEQTGEALLDFILSAKDANGEYIAEWNAYRYAPVGEGTGVMLFAISHRAYGNDDVRAFLGNLGTVRADQINKIAQFSLPQITLPE